MWQFTTYNEVMAQSIRISDDLYCLAKNASQALERPLAQQLEYWARLGSALDACGLSSAMAMELLGNGARADDFVAAATGRGARHDGGLELLRDRQCKDAEEVASGHRSARSLFLFQKGDLAGYSFTQNPSSEFERYGDGW
jgi:hypothetical protein